MEVLHSREVAFLQQQIKEMRSRHQETESRLQKSLIEVQKKMQGWNPSPSPLTLVLRTKFVLIFHAFLVETYRLGDVLPGKDHGLSIHARGS